ncbi:hypothetical protein IWQ54_002260 [Labrenzia sp. EL_195]|nr:hypothetical protein [Labrenzia sp. EL_195]
MKKFLIGACAALGWITSAQAAPVTFAGLTFDDTAFVDVSNAVQGTFDPTGVIGGNFATGINLQEPPGSIPRVAELSFTDNTLVNGSGDDLALFVPSFVFNLGVATEFPGPTGGPTPFQGRNGISTGGGMIAFLYDLSDYGIADGGSVSSFFLTRLGDVEAFTFAAAALNGGPIIDPPVAVPLPAALPMLVGGLGLLGIVRTRRKRGAMQDKLDL